MIDFRYVVGLGVCCLLLWLFPIPMMVLFGAAIAGWLLFMFYLFLVEGSTASSTGNWESKDVEARD
jgi:hypothetical protein